MKGRCALGTIFGLALTIPVTGEGRPWYETEGIKSAFIDESLCAFVRAKFNDSLPWTLKNTLSFGGGYYGEMSASAVRSEENKGARVAQTYTLKNADAEFMSKFLLRGELQIPWYVDAVTALPRVPNVIAVALTVADTMQKVATPSGIADKDFVSHLLTEGGGDLRYTLEVGTDSNRHTWATRMYTFVTEINHKRKEYVLCNYRLPIHVWVPVPDAPVLSVTEKK
jgi:hypothetical protein